MNLFPLLSRELNTAAAVTRTYVVRMLLAVTAAALVLTGVSVAITDDALVGLGESTFKLLVGAQAAAVLLVLPGLMSVSVTRDKENGVLPLLLLSNMPPWSILLQKYISRLIPVLTLLLAAMPMIALAYAFGGVSWTILLAAVYLLFVASLNVGALALLLSCFCRRSATAIISSYVVTPLVALAVNGLMLYAMNTMLAVFRLESELPLLMMFSLPLLVMTGIYLAVARNVLVSHAFAEGSSVAGNLLGGAKSICRRILFSRARRRPEDLTRINAPVAWRVTRRGLLSWRVQLRLAVIAVVLFFGAAIFCSRSKLNAVDVLLWCQLPACYLFTFVYAAIIPAIVLHQERYNETLEVLRTAMSNFEIIDQLLHPRWRLFAMVTFLFAVILWTFVEIYSATVIPMMAGISMITAYLLAGAIALKTRRRATALIITACVVIAWMILPLLGPWRLYVFSPLFVCWALGQVGGIAADARVYSGDELISSYIMGDIVVCTLFQIVISVLCYSFICRRAKRVWWDGARG